jgi:predicted MFS family arabinose efflux permease
MSAVANYFREDRGLALGAFYVGFDAGGAGGSAIGGLSLSLTSGWRSAFLVAPLLGIAVVAGLFVARSSFARTEAERGSVSLGRDAVQLLRKKRILVIMLFAFLATYSIAVWQNYLTTYWNSVKDVDNAIAAYGYAAVLVSGGFGKLILGRMSDRRPRGRVILAIVSASLALFVLFFLSGNVYSGFFLALGAGFASSAIFPVMQALASDSCDGKTGTVLGLTTTFQSVATVLSPTLTSYFTPQSVGTAIALNVTVPMVAVVLVAVFLTDPRRTRRQWRLA